jgi:cytochrome c556
MWVQELRDAGMGAYKVGQAKNPDAILDAAAAVSDACLHCHQKYRNVPGGIPNRC